MQIAIHFASKTLSMISFSSKIPRNENFLLINILKIIRQLEIFPSCHPALWQISKKNWNYILNDRKKSFVWHIPVFQTCRTFQIIWNFLHIWFFCSFSGIFYICGVLYNVHIFFLIFIHIFFLTNKDITLYSR